VQGVLECRAVGETKLPAGSAGLYISLALAPSQTVNAPGGADPLTPTGVGQGVGSRGVWGRRNWLGPGDGGFRGTSV
jgi:hypothetical protein